MAGDGGRGSSAKCTAQAKTALPAGAPVLKPGEWTDITPKDLVPLKGTNQTMIAQGIALDPCDASTLYWGSTPFDTSKGGSSRAPTPDRPGRSSANSMRRCTCGSIPATTSTSTWATACAVRRRDSGCRTTVEPRGRCPKPSKTSVPRSASRARAACTTSTMCRWIPSDFKHVLLSFHSPWNWGDSNKGSGVLESKDGGDTWIPHGYPNQFGYGTSVDFLYEPSLGIGDSGTWMVGEQGGGHYRTTDSGKTWTKVSNNGIFTAAGTSTTRKAGLCSRAAHPRTCAAPTTAPRGR